MSFGRVSKILPVVAFAVASFLGAPRAYADKTYEISSLSIDEITVGSLQAFSLYLKNLRETSQWETEADRMIVDADSVSECEEGKFAIVPFHSVSGVVVRDGATFFRCGKRIGQFAVDRSGPGVKPMTNEALYTFAIPAPSASETFRFRFDLHRIEISSQATLAGRVSRLGFELGSYPFRFRVEDTEAVTGTTTTKARNYQMEILAQGTWKWAHFEQKKIRVGGRPPSYEYRVTGQEGRTDMTSGKYQGLYSSNFEANSVGLLYALLNSPSASFPFVIDPKTVTP